MKLDTKIKFNCQKFGLEDVKTLEDFRSVLKGYNAGFQSDGVAFWYFLRSEVEQIKPLLNKKPEIPYASYVAKVKGRLESEIFKLNKIEDAVITAPDVIYGQVLSVLQREIIKPWYEKSGGAKITKIDPKGIERIDIIESAYFDEIKEGNKLLGSGRLMKVISPDTDTLGSRLKFVSPDQLELVILYLSSQRKLVAKTRNTNAKADIKSIDVEVGGSVSGTTLKELKQGLRTFANSSNNKLYWLEVVRLLERNL